MSDPVSYGLVSGGFSALSFGLIRYIYSRYKAKKVSGLVLPVGKTTLCDKITNTCNDIFFVDVDKWLNEQQPEKYKELCQGRTQQQFLIQFYPMLKQYVKGLTKSFGKKKLVLVSSNYDLLHQLNIKVRVFCPTGDLLHKLPYDATEINKKVLSITHLTSENRKYKIFNTFDELYGLVRRKFQIRNNILNLH